jgi:hypothetical protein
MTNIKRIVLNSVLLELIALACGCVVVPHEGYYDGEHHRYYHDRAWHECVEHDEHCG